MKNANYLPLLLMITSSMVLSSCGKTDPAVSRTQLLTQNTWALNTFTSSDPNVQASGVILKGSVWQFKTDKTLAVTLTLSGVPATGTGTWSLSSDEQQLTITTIPANATSSGTMDIQTLNSTNMDLVQSVPGIINHFNFVKK